jgi:hypothetical protein
LSGVDTLDLSLSENHPGEPAEMLGWMLVFMMMSVLPVVAGEIRGAGFSPAIAASIIFGFLLIVSALTRALRGQA